jgi:cyclin B
LKLLRYLPSEIAAACVFIARHSNGRHGWSPTLLKFAKYNEEQIVPVARSILADRELIRTRALHAVQEKYLQRRFGEIARTATLKHDF